MSTVTYAVGDRITYVPFLGGRRTGTVIARDPDIKNGRAGFDMETDDGETFWGYDSQVIGAVTSA